MEEQDKQEELYNIFKADYPIITTEIEGGYRSVIHIVDEVKEPHKFIEMVTLLGAAEDGDEVIFKLNTPGGQLNSTIMLCDAMQNSKAVLIADIVGEVASAGTLIMLNCDAIRVADYGSVMIHSYSSGTYGKRGEVAAQMAFELEQLKQVFVETYVPFLTVEECDRVLDGMDKYMDRDEILNRWEVVKKQREERTEKHMLEEVAIMQEQRVKEAEQVLLDAGKL